MRSPWREGPERASISGFCMDEQPGCFGGFGFEGAEIIDRGYMRTRDPSAVNSDTAAEKAKKPGQHISLDHPSRLSLSSQFIRDGHLLLASLRDESLHT